jgi:hypothetical protein
MAGSHRDGDSGVFVVSFVSLVFSRPMVLGRAKLTNSFHIIH